MILISIMMDLPDNFETKPMKKLAEASLQSDNEIYIHNMGKTLVNCNTIIHKTQHVYNKHDYSRIQR